MHQANKEHYKIDTLEKSIANHELYLAGDTNYVLKEPKKYTCGKYVASIGHERFAAQNLYKLEV